MQLREDIERFGQQTRLDQRQYDDKLRALPKIPLSIDNLRDLITRYEQVARRAPGPAPLLAQLSQSLDAYPGIALEQVEWEIAEKIDTGAPPPPGMATGPYAQATVVARLPVAMSGDQRGQINLVAEFARHLGLAPETLVVVLQPPVDTQSGKTLKSGDEASALEAPRFSFRLIRKL